MGGMKRPTKAQGVVPMMLGLFFYTVTGIILYQGKCAIRGHGGIATRQNDPGVFSFQVGCGIARGTLGVGAGIHALIYGEKNPPSAH
jgi:hypothetical protein